MSSKDNKTVVDLSQVKQNQAKLIDSIDRLKESGDEQMVKDLEKIESAMWNTVMEIDAVVKRRDQDLADTIERNTVLYRMLPRKPRKLEQCGNIRF